MMGATSSEIKLVVFDWDGTLADSLGRIVDCLQLAAQRHQLPEPTAAAARDIVGLSLVVAIDRLWPGVSAELNAQLIESYSEFYEAHAPGPCPFYDGAEQMLDQLLAADFTLAVATGKRRQGLDESLQGLNAHRWFAASRCADETASKPDPLMLLELMEELGVSPEQTVMVGDSEYDMQMAKNAGVHRLAVSFGAHHRERLHPYELLGCVDHLSELPVLLK
ncbi:MAG: HAD family hydrolase [Porticoccaceae bacterium]